MKKNRCFIFLTILIWGAFLGRSQTVWAGESPDSRALVISRGDYHSSSLDLTPGPENDAKNFTRVLTRAYGEKIKILEKEREGVTTAEGVAQAIREAFEDSTEDTVNYFYYTGHGVRSGLYLGSGTMTAEQLAQAFQGIRGKNILVIDCCFSGAMISRSTEQFSDLFIEAFEKAAVSMKKSRSALNTGEFYVLTASSSEEESWQGDLAEDGASIGLFSGNLAYGCGVLPGRVNRDFGYEQTVFPADYNEDGRISFNEIYQFLKNQLYSSNVRRYPEYEEGLFLPAKSVNAMSLTVQKASVSYEEDGKPKLTLHYLAKETQQIEFACYRGTLWDLSCLMRYCAQTSLPNTRKPESVVQGTCEAVKGTGTARIDLQEFGGGLSGGNYAVMVRAPGDEFSYLLPFVIQDQKESVLLNAFSLTAEEEMLYADGIKEICFTADFGTGRSEELIRPYITAVIKDQQGNRIRKLGENLLADVVYKNTASYIFYRKLYWNGTDDNGKLVPPGSYELEAEAVQGTNVSTKSTAIQVAYLENPILDISVKQMPDKTLYEEGEDFQTAGLRVYARFQNGTEQEITDYEIVGGKKLAAGTGEIFIQFGALCAKIPITVQKKAEPVTKAPAENFKVASISLKINGKKTSAKKIVIGQKEKVHLKPIFLSSNAKKKKVTYRSSNKSVSSVSAKGVICGKKRGTARITVSAQGGARYVLQVVVRKAPSRIKTKVSKKILKKGSQFRIKMKISPKEASYRITCHSSRPKVASVSSSGKVLAKKRGSAVITIKTYNGRRTKIKIIVK